MTDSIYTYSWHKPEHPVLKDSTRGGFKKHDVVDGISGLGLGEGKQEWFAYRYIF